MAYTFRSRGQRDRGLGGETLNPLAPRLLTASTLFLLIAGAGPFARADSAQDRGAKLFREKGCAFCHKINGVGGSEGPNLSGVGKRLQKPAIKKQIVEGGLNMPPFNEAVTPAETRDLVEYLHKCKHSIAASAGAAGH